MLLDQKAVCTISGFQTVFEQYQLYSMNYNKVVAKNTLMLVYLNKNILKND